MKKLRGIKRKGSGIVGCMLCVILLHGACSKGLDPAPRHHALLIRHHYVPSTKKANRLHLYNVNLMAVDLLRTRGLRSIKTREDANFRVVSEQCRNYISWYLNHLNPVDKYGISGSIDDYDAYMDGREQRVKEPVRIAALSATFILTVDWFFRTTGYRQMIAQRADAIETVAYTIPFMIDQARGLVPEYPGSHRYLLADNCLAYAAMKGYAQLSREFGWGKEQFYEEIALDLHSFIIKYFYRPNGTDFYWMLEDSGNTSFDRKYAVNPDAQVQEAQSRLFPVLFDILKPDQQKERQALWLAFCKDFDRSMKTQETAVKLIYAWTAEKMGVPRQVTENILGEEQHEAKN